jgi:ubiquitin C-terminal hydrolase
MKQVKVDLEELGCKKWDEEIKRTSSIFNDTLMGQLLSTITCSVCKYKSHTFEPYFILELPLPNKPKATLKDCFIEYSKEEDVDCNLWECPQCNQRPKAKKSLQIWRLAPVLILCFKRFKNSHDDIKRNDCLVKINMTSEDVGFTLAHLGLSKGKSQSRVYEPFSFIVAFILIKHHSGTLSQGHYTCSIKNCHNGEWTLIDDDVFKAIPKASIDVVSLALPRSTLQRTT